MAYYDDIQVELHYIRVHVLWYGWKHGLSNGTLDNSIVRWTLHIIKGQGCRIRT